MPIIIASNAKYVYRIECTWTHETFKYFSLASIYATVNLNEKNK